MLLFCFSGEKKHCILSSYHVIKLYVNVKVQLLNISGKSFTLLVQSIILKIQSNKNMPRHSKTQLLNDARHQPITLIFFFRLRLPSQRTRLSHSDGKRKRNRRQEEQASTCGSEARSCGALLPSSRYLLTILPSFL